MWNPRAEGYKRCHTKNIHRIFMNAIFPWLFSSSLFYLVAIFKFNSNCYCSRKLCVFLCIVYRFEFAPFFATLSLSPSQSRPVDEFYTSTSQQLNHHWITIFNFDRFLKLHSHNCYMLLVSQFFACIGTKPNTWFCCCCCRAIANGLDVVRISRKFKLPNLIMCNRRLFDIE